MSTNTVTIVIPTFRRPQKVRRAIQSVLDQTYKDCRILVFDNASADETAAVVSDMVSMDSRIQYFAHDRNIGMHANFNHAIDRVTTPFFGILADDDYYLPTFLEDAMRAFEFMPSAQLSILSAPMVTEDGVFIADQLAAWPKEGGYEAGESIITAATGAHPIITTCIFRLALRDQIQLDAALDSIADIPILVSLLAKYPFYLSKKPGGLFCRHANAHGTNFARATNAKAVVDAYLRVEKYFHDDSTIDARTLAIVDSGLKRRLDKLLFFSMLENITLNQPDTVRYLRQVISKRSLSPWLLPAGCLAWASQLMGSLFLSNSIGIVRRVIRALRGVIHAK